ncbi:putative HNH endonuclease [Vibrio phage 501E54-1]|nr:putative HNH endonuclease [Vibrio phage 501E54-1]
MEGYECNGCKEAKSLTAFYKNNRSNTGKPRQPCKDCCKQREAEKRAEYSSVEKIIPEFKICSVCQLEKSSKYFHKRKDTPTGLRSDCKDCYNLKSKKYYEDNTETVIARTNEYQKNHKEQRAVRKREKYNADPDKYRKIDKEWRLANPDKVAAYSKKYREGNQEKLSHLFKQYYYSNIEKFRNKRQEWYKNNKSKSAFYSAKRRANKKLATPVWADQDTIKEFYTEANYLQESVDHIIPLSHPLVCGLHCEFNLQTIPLLDNIVKNNNFEICEHTLPEYLEEE